MEYKKKYLVFLDFDGVLTSTRQHYADAGHYEMWSKFDPVAIDFLNNRIANKYENVEFVLTTTWKDKLDNFLDTFHILNSMLVNAGFRGKLAEVWRTNPDRLADLEQKDRAYQVKDYLENIVDPDDVLDYIIFDDTYYMFDSVLGKKRWVRTDSENGMLWKHMQHAASLMGNWNEK